MARKIEPKEILKQSLRTKKVYFYKGDGFEVKSREVLKNGVEIHFPFDIRDGSQKYKYISVIVFEGISPTIVHGVYKKWQRGLGFTRYLSPLIDFLENYPGIGKIIISKKKNSQLKTVEIVFNVDDIERLYQRIRPFRDQQSEELKGLTRNLFADIFPNKVQKESARYYSGQLTRLVESKSIKPSQLSSNDIQAISGLIASLPAEHLFIKQGKFIATKEKFDIVSIESTLKKYRKLLARKNDSKKLEEDWHQFFKKHSWILSQMFASPMVIFGDKAYVGGKDLNNQKGKIVDFIYKNSFSRSAAIIEIKTHKTLLMMKRPYRKPDIFSTSKELSGAINQALDQKDTLQKNYHTVARNTGVESFNPVCIVLAGQITTMKKDYMKSFELFRNNSKDAIIVTYDELLKRIETILEIFLNKPKKKT
ncbi:MAG: DUF4263 domain-containing protein [Candidatus Pacebacteria bacterium]|nr:DUF4263 domain-containing protein [Candidatus Paceibacterota bacterium]